MLHDSTGHQTQARDISIKNCLLVLFVCMYVIFSQYVSHTFLLATVMVWQKLWDWQVNSKREQQGIGLYKEKNTTDSFLMISAQQHRADVRQCIVGSGNVFVDKNKKASLNWLRIVCCTKDTSSMLCCQRKRLKGWRNERIMLWLVSKSQCKNTSFFLRYIWGISFDFLCVRNSLLFFVK